MIESAANRSDGASLDFGNPIFRVLRVAFRAGWRIEADF
jgi:hypothetical protein